jgi:hypothetical protein
MVVPHFRKAVKKEQRNNFKKIKAARMGCFKRFFQISCNAVTLPLSWIVYYSARLAKL